MRISKLESLQPYTRRQIMFTLYDRVIMRPAWKRAPGYRRIVEELAGIGVDVDNNQLRRLAMKIRAAVIEGRFPSAEPPASARPRFTLLRRLTPQQRRRCMFWLYVYGFRDHDTVREKLAAEGISVTPSSLYRFGNHIRNSVMQYEMVSFAAAVKKRRRKRRSAANPHG